MAPSSVLVTGGSRGLGLELVRQMLISASPPLHLFATYRNPATAAPLLDLASTSPALKPLQLDVTAHDTHPTLVSQVQEVVGDEGLNLLVNNAGIGKMPRSLQSITPEEMMQHFETNCVAPLFLSRSLLPLLKKAAGPDGKGKPKSANRAAIVNISAALGSLGEVHSTGPGMYPIRCSKAGLNMATAALARDFDMMRTGVLLAAIHPGWVRTDMGGPKAPVAVEDSAAAIINTIDSFTEKNHGTFVTWDNKHIPW